jgi:hypothetical protein
MRHDTAKRRSNTRGEYVVIRSVGAQRSTNLCCRTVEPVADVATDRPNPSARPSSAMGDGVPGAGAAAASAVWIEQVGETSTHSNSGQQCARVHDVSLLNFAANGPAQPALIEHRCQLETRLSR